MVDEHLSVGRGPEVDIDGVDSRGSTRTCLGIYRRKLPIVGGLRFRGGMFADAVDGQRT